MNFHFLDVNKSFELLGAQPEGLSAQESELRLAKYGPNEIQGKKKKLAWLLFVGQFKDFMILILILAAVVSGFVGDLADTIIILVIVFLNAVVGFIQEYRAEQALEALKKMAVLTTEVLREGKAQSSPASALAPGDVVLLEAGNAVPADLRLIETHSLRIDESALTGESAPVDKTDRTIQEQEIPLGDRFNMAYKGALVTNGRGKGLVVATGMDTEIGKIARMLQEKEAVTPLQQRMADFGRKLSYGVLAICALLFGVGLLRGEAPVNMLLLSISLAVAAIPEALPALITVALARGANRLVKKNALIRKLPAVETLGSVNFICTDKTGTLTLNQMQVVQTEERPTDIQPEPDISLFGLAISLNQDVKMSEDGSLRGDPTEIALLRFAQQKWGAETCRRVTQNYPREAELPFDSDRKCMTTVHRFGARYLVFSKGAAEAIAAKLATGPEQAALTAEAYAWSEKGLRVIAYAYTTLDAIPHPFSYDTVERNLNFAGITGMIDPPREEVKAAIADCKTAGIRPVMITGDHPATAAAIAREIGILEPGDLMLTGLELQRLQPEMFEEQVEKIRVYARVSPDQKLQIVKALQKKKHFAAMTGDGVNDAPSLKAANIGVAMGINGTDVSKEAAHMILLDDNFATIVRAVREGRGIYDNIRKFVKYIMTCNSAEIWTIFLAPLLGLPMPLLPIHILWINLVTDGLPGLALAGEKPEPDIMRRPPRPAGESLFAQGAGYHILWVGLFMAALTLGTQAWSVHRELEHWQTMVFTVLSLSQLGHVLAIRSERTFLYRQGIFSNMPLFGAVALTFLLQMIVIYLPAANAVFNTQPLSWQELAGCIGVSAILFHAVEAEKWWKKRKMKNKE
ncbi:MAG: cation-translocating P-type ATPase [Saprospiraceae bacterium]